MTSMGGLIFSSLRPTGKRSQGCTGSIGVPQSFPSTIPFSLCFRLLYIVPPHIPGDISRGRSVNAVHLHSMPPDKHCIRIWILLHCRFQGLREILLTSAVSARAPQHFLKSYENLLRSILNDWDPQSIEIAHHSRLASAIRKALDLFNHLNFKTSLGHHLPSFFCIPLHQERH